MAEIALVDGATGSGRLVRLGQSRGDVEAPQVVSTGEALVAAMLEPNASGFSLQLARLVGDKLHWGAELPQERDESLAFDLAVGDEALVVAWDAARDDGEGTEILLATLDPAELAITVEPRSVSPAGTDAELPRLVPRPGGFWLVYVARKTSALPPHPSDEELGKDPKQERYAAEMIEQSWVEIQPLGPTGKPDGGARRATSPLGHVQGYDVRAAAGALHLAWRDDDTPTGAQGGRVSLLVAQLAGLDEPTIVADEDVGLGGPSLLAGWLGIADAGGRMRLAPLGSDGGVLGEMRAEPVLGLGQLLAAGNQSLLLARPAGPAVELVLVECDRPAGKP